MNIQALLQEQSIMIPLEASDKESCIRAMIDGLEAAGCLRDKSAYLDAVLKREETGSTGIGFGVAIPHGKSGGVSKAGLAFAKLTQPLDWQSLDGNPVSIVFMIAVPEEAAGNEHLQILIALSRKLIDEQFRQSLLNVTEPQQLIDLLQTI
ncbi:MULTISPECIES: PTS sugar transporter subunit IIA [Paenibacillus]|uniref:PTS fructose transporter subunit IIA n=1 Tax=Paenibacillus elgii TaxID=189691 RepID=A0A2T6FXB7_9BACL|nr:MULTISPECIES: fructose PTS transporter subunit IIA [Paenibacillus]MCM3269752.1 fructose PTS transporter subunit IIA [Paenibacillus elgii]NEN81308.1 PTS transporter subunit EIIA [Paenibacillus elgii]PUA36532.1 PTS fructose transporter subunit IIA [Paenibacillus elgii]GLI04533.1 PTS fructose transporter subunit IIA [Paenibacillus tyrfis]GMX65341.1 fructose PTS transporter subunit IIA [Paenibacillus elgii]